MRKIRLYSSYLISIEVVILILVFAIINKHPKECLGVFGYHTSITQGMFGAIPISGADVLRVRSVTLYLKASKVIGHIGRVSARLDSSFVNLKSAIYQYITYFPKLATSVYLWIAIWGGKVYQSKNHLEAVLESFLPQTTASLLFGMVFGGSTRLTPEQEHLFKITGMLHVVSASGYNVGLVRGISQSIYSRFWWRTTATFFTIGTIFLYLYLADMTPSVVRAGIMISLQVVAVTIYQRQYHGLWLLGLTAGVMLIWNPLYLESLSFQFSILACFGILFWSAILYRPEMYNLSSGQTFFPSVSRGLMEAFWLTCAAQSFSWGIQISVFGELSLVSLVANPAAIWLTPWLTMSCLAFLALAISMSELPVIGILFLPLVAWPLSALTSIFLKIISFFGLWESGVLIFPTLPRWFPYIWWLGMFSLAFAIKKIYQRQEAKYYVT